MWTWCNSLQISSFKCLIYPSSRSWEFLLQFSAFAPSSCSSLTRISPFGTAVFRVLAKLCYKQLFVGIYNMYKKKKSFSEAWYMENHKHKSALCAFTGCRAAVYCHLHAQIFAYATPAYTKYGFAYTPSHRCLIRVGKSWVILCTQICILKIDLFGKVHSTKLPN